MESNTVVQALLDCAGTLASRPAVWREQGAGFQPLLWHEGRQQVSRLARGLIAAGLEPGEVVGVLGGNWPLVSLAAMAAGGVPAVLDARWPREALAKAAGGCRPRMLVVGEAEQAVGEGLRQALPQLRAAVSPRGGEGWIALDALSQQGDALPAGASSARLAAIEPGSPAAVYFSNGNAGAPRPVVATQANLLWATDRLARLVGVGKDDAVLSLLPAASPAAQTAGLWLPARFGAQVYLARGDELPLELLREARPTLLLAPPPFWEALREAISERFARELPNRAKVTDWARGLALERHRLDSEQKTVAPSLLAKCALAATLVHDALKAAFGLDRARVLLCAGGAASPAALEFFASIDAPLYELYGQAETCGVAAASVPGSARIGSQGRPLPGAEARLSDDGEIWLRGGNVVPGQREDGWLRTGDVGRIDCQGFLHVDGRRADLLVGPDGQLISPRRVEARLQGIPAVRQAAVFARSGRLGALLTLDRAAARRIARELRLPSAPEELIGQPSFVAWVREQVEKAGTLQPPGERIARFELLAEPFSVEAGELGTSGEPRRETIAARHEDQLHGLFEDEPVRLRPLTG